MKYREDMMENHEKGPGKHWDRPGITPNNLDLDVSPTCLREKEMVERDLLVGFGGRRKRPMTISSRVTWSHTFSVGADCLQSYDGPSACKFLT